MAYEEHVHHKQPSLSWLQTTIEYCAAIGGRDRPRSAGYFNPESVLARRERLKCPLAKLSISGENLPAINIDRKPIVQVGAWAFEAYVKPRSRIRLLGTGDISVMRTGLLVKATAPHKEHHKNGQGGEEFRFVGICFTHETFLSNNELLNETLEDDLQR